MQIYGGINSDEGLAFIAGIKGVWFALMSAHVWEYNPMSDDRSDFTQSPAVPPESARMVMPARGLQIYGGINSDEGLTFIAGTFIHL